MEHKSEKRKITMFKDSENNEERDGYKITKTMESNYENQYDSKNGPL